MQRGSNTSEGIEFLRRYEGLKAALLNKKQFVRTNQILNLPKFVAENEKLLNKLLLELDELRALKGQLKSHQSRPKSANSANIPQLVKGKPENSMLSTQLNSLRQRNQYLKSQIIKMRERHAKRQINETPHLKQKQKQILDQSAEVERLTKLSQQLQQAVCSGELLELYQSMCRECQSLRKYNNQISEEIKSSILQINKLSGGQENPNMFLMNLKF